MKSFKKKKRNKKNKIKNYIRTARQCNLQHTKCRKAGRPSEKKCTISKTVK